MNIFPSIDTPVCAASVRRFNSIADRLGDTTVMCVSKDLPFAHDRFCGSEGIDKAIPVIALRGLDFGADYNVRIIDGPLAGLLARAIVIIDETGKIIYTQLAPEIAEEPDYDDALTALH